MEVPCEFCKQLVLVEQVGVYQWTAGWVKSRSGGGGHGVTLPERSPRWAHAYCVERAAAGFDDQRQQSMFGGEEENRPW